MNIKTVIFDFDGTLAYLNIDFSAMRTELENLLTLYGVSPLLLNEPYALEMINEATVLISNNNVTQGLSFNAEALQIVVDHEIRAAKKGRILPGVINMLGYLLNAGIKVGIITRNCDKAVRMVFPDIDNFCNVFIPRDYVTKVKPHPYHLSIALEKIAENNIEGSLMVGDHVIDIEGGKRMGMKTVGVLTGKKTREDFIKAGADLILESATKIQDLI